MKRFTKLTDILDNKDIHENYFKYQYENTFETSEDFSPELYESIIPIIKGNRLIDAIASVNESEDIVAMLSESEKLSLEEVIWEAIYVYSTETNEQILEGFWNSVVGGLKDMPAKALQLAKKAISNIGAIVKQLATWLSAGYKAAAAYTGGMAETIWGKAKGKILESTFKNHASLKDDIVNLKTTVSYLRNKGAENMLKKGEGEGVTLAQQGAAQDKEEKEKVEAKIDKALNTDEGYKPTSSVPNESIKLIFESQGAGGIKYMINKIRRSDMNLQSLVQEANEYQELSNLILNEASPEGVLDASAKEKKQGLLSSFSAAGTIMKVVSFMVSGIIVLFEKVLKWAMSKAISWVSAAVKASGGPGVFEFAGITTIVAVTIGAVLEFGGMDLISNALGGWAEKIAHTVHHLNPMGIIQHAAEHAIPGVGIYIKAITLMTVLFIAVDHISHTLKAAH